MKTKFVFKNHLMTNLLTYGAVLLIVPISCYFIVQSKTAPKAHEKFTVFVATSLKEDKNLKSELTDMFKEDYVVKVESHPRSEGMFQTYVDTYGRISDVLIFPKAYLDKIENFPYFDFASGNNYYSDTNYVKYNRHYGLYLNNSKLNEYMDFSDDEYYLLIGDRSVHTSNIFSKGETNQIYRFLTTYYDVKNM